MYNKYINESKNVTTLTPVIKFLKEFLFNMSPFL